MLTRLVQRLQETLKSTKPPDSDRMLVVLAGAQMALDLYATFGR
jgi:hypothetical protein